MFGQSIARKNALGALLVFASAFVLHIDNLDNELLGWDTYATIIASRIESWADLWGTFSEVLMDGRLPFGDFYRPVGNLFIALDYAIWDLEPLGYQLTNLALWSLSASLVYLLARRLIGHGAILAPIVAVGFYILHPAALSILSVAARRTETLQIVFILLTLISLPVSAGERNARRYLLAGIFAALAVGSKETGIIVLPLAFIHQFLTIERTAILDRAIGAFRAVIPAGVLIAGILGARFYVIGGMGGYHTEASMSLIERVVSFLPRYLQTVAVTGAPGRSSAAGVLFLAILLALVSVAVWLLFARRNWSEDQRRRVFGLGAVGLFWLLGQVGLACLSFQFTPRYLVGMVAGLSLMLAALVEGILITRTTVTATKFPASVFAAALVAASMVSGLAGSKLWYDYPGIAEASRIQKNGLRALSAEIRKHPRQYGKRISVQRQVAILDDAVDHAWMLSPWSLQAWLEMSFPDTPIKVGISTNARQSKSHWNLVLVSEDPDGE